jgi:UDP-glucose 4-epimerase
MDEETPLSSDIYEMGAYTVAKVWQERVVARMAQSHGWDLTLMRPGFIWGPEHAEIAGMGRHIGRVYLMFGPLTRLPLSHVVNCADCIVTATESPAAVGENFNVTDNDDIRVWRYVREFARQTGQPGIPIPVPYRMGLGVAQLASWASRLMFGKKGKLPSLLVPRRFEAQFKPLRFSNRKLVERLAWRPPLSFKECLRDTFGREQ